MAFVLRFDVLKNYAMSFARFDMAFLLTIRFLLLAITIILTLIIIIISSSPAAAPPIRKSRPILPSIVLLS